MKNNTYFVSWEEYTELVLDIYTHFIGTNISHIYGIPRGGLIPAVMLSHLFDVPLIDNLLLVQNNLTTLIVDDIVDTGETIKKFTDNNFLTASLFINSTRCKLKPTFYSASSDKWVVFPYETKINDETSKVKFRT